MKTTPALNPIASAISGSSSPATSAGRLFAQSETDASTALEMSARALGDAPSYDAYTAHRVEWVNGYCEVKPQAKGQSADKAFNRFKDRLVEAFAITIPKAVSASATKKAEERAKKAEAIAAKYKAVSDDELHLMITRAYEQASRTPLASDALIKELRKVLKDRTKTETDAVKAELKTARDVVIKAVKECSNIEKLTLAAEILSPANDVSVSE